MGLFSVLSIFARMNTTSTDESKELNTTSTDESKEYILQPQKLAQKPYFKADLSHKQLYCDRVGSLF